jgi:hypothetical protein
MIIHRTFALGTVLFLALCACGALALPATQNNSNPQTPPSQPSAQTNPADKTAEDKKTAEEKEREILRQEQSQRLLRTLPNFATTNRRDPPPLTAAQKFHLFRKSAFDPVEFGVVGMQAAISQGEDEFPEYGQGASGFGKRYGATLADEVSSSFFTDYFYPVLFKEDPRYFRLGEGSIKHRLGYALKQEVICHRDQGGRSFSWENVFGAFTSGAVSNAYYPESDRGFGLTMSRSAISAAYGSLGGVVDEFYPDINHWLFHRHQEQPAN